MDVPESDDLYGLPLGEFVPARDALAKRLRADGRRDDAAAVTALRRPSAAAWAVNQLMRTQRRAAGELLDAGAALVEAQAGVLAGRRGAGDLRTAAERQRTAVDALHAQAGGLLDERGRAPSAQTLDRVADTLHAVSLDQELHAEAAAGRLVHAQRHIGLGALGAAAGPPRAAGALETERAARRKAAQAAERAAGRAAATRAAMQEKRDAARAALAEAEAGLDRAVREEEQAGDAARRLRAEAD